MDDEGFRRVIEEIDFQDFNTKSNFTPLELIRSASESENTKHRLDLSLLVSPIVKHLGKNTYENKPDFHSVCESLILHIASLGIPEEILLDFIEEAEDSDSIIFKVMLKCFLVCLRTIDVTNVHPISWCFNTIIRHLNNIDMPEDHKLEGKERTVFDSDPKVFNISILFEDVLKFVEGMVSEILPRFSAVILNKPVLKDIVIQFLLKLLGKPLAYMDLESTSSKGSFRIASEKIVHFVSDFSSDLLEFIHLVNYNDKVSTSDDVVDFDYTNLSLAVFYYLLYHEGICLDKAPEVYSQRYIFENIVKLSLVTFEISDSLVQRKGLLLSDSVLDRISDDSLKISDLDHRSQTKYLETLPAIMVYSEVKDNRQLAVQIFKKYLTKVDSVGRHTIILNIQKVVPQPGFIGLLATIVKDILVKSFSQEVEDRQVFRGKRLESLIKKFCHLHKGVETDLIEISDTIISSLNLLRFLFIRDTENTTGIWDYVQWIKREFLTPLKTGINLSRAHYEVQLREVDSAPPGVSVSVTVAGETLPNMERDQKKSVLNNALNTFDLMDSLCSRVTECVENRRST